MSFEASDITVVGGGSAGLLAALSAKENGSDVLVLESKDTIGHHEHCAGLLSIEGLKKLNLTSLPSDIIQNNKIIGTRLYSPSGALVTVSKNTETAYVVDRVMFNQHLGFLAEERGVNIQTSSKAIGLIRDEKSIQIKLGKKSSHKRISSKIAILAEGRFPNLNKEVGLPFPSRDKTIHASMYYMSNIKDIDSKYVELYQAKEFAPGFFSWIIPINEDTAKVGIGSNFSPSGKYLDKFIKTHPVAKEKLSKAKVEKRTSGAIPLGSSIRKTHADNVLVVGDAAGQTKPTTGGGVILGGIAARIAGRIASRAIEENNTSANFLSQYTKLWKKEMSKNLFVMKHVRYYLNSLKERDIERLFHLIDTPKMNALFTSVGDVDNQKDLVFKVLLNNKFWPFILRTGFLYLIKKGLR
ncbi:MAG: NAD(P)/FAD-dependent oxidoreductase [Candidatus Heimdallarchaeaceae archaeon]